MTRALVQLRRSVTPAVPPLQRPDNEDDHSGLARTRNDDHLQLTHPKSMFSRTKTADAELDRYRKRPMRSSTAPGEPASAPLRKTGNDDMQLSHHGRLKSAEC